ncbi:MAG: hypothetical protein V1752_04205 [Candidatus Firestonebacteria bacterium]
MKKVLIFFALAGVFSFQAVSAQSISLSAEVKGGYVLPLPNLSNTLNGAISYGGAVQAVLPCIPLITKWEVSFNTATLASKNNAANTLALSPLILSGIFDIPMPGLNPFVKVGGGLIFETSTLIGVVTIQNDPVFIGGVGISAPLMPAVSIKVEADYMFIYQTWVTGATENGSTINLNLGVNAGF